MQQLNRPDMSVTFEVLNEARFRLLRSVQPWNIPFMSVTFAVLKPLMFSSFSERQLANMSAMLFTLWVSKFERSSDSSFVHI